MIRRMSLVMLAVSCSSVAFAGGALPGAPVAKAVPFEETVQGIKVSDPYRWMESGGDEYTAWLKAQGAAADGWLARLPMRAKLLEGIAARSGAIEGVGRIQQRGQYVFLARRPVGAQTPKLVVRDGLNGAERVLFDPASLDTAEVKGHAINYWEASPTGAHVYLGVSAGGSEEATLKVVETATGKFVDGDVPQALFNGGTSEIGGLFPQWLPDGSGFFYNRLAEGATRDTPGYFLNTRLFLRRIGRPAAQDVLVVAKGVAGAPDMTEVESPFAFTQPSSRTVLLGLSDGVGRSLRLLSAPLADVLAGRAAWTPIGSRADQIESVAQSGESLYLMRRDKSRGRVLVLGRGQTDVAAAREVVPEGKGVIDSVVATRDGVYVVGHSGEGATLGLIGADGKFAEVALPFNGASYLVDGAADSDGLLFSLENYVTPRKRLLVRGTQVTDTGLGPLPPFAVDAYVTETVMATARDGTEIPLDIVRRKDTPKDGKRPALLDAYGSYGFSADPYFNPRLYALLDAGAIYATCKTRGGGEYGRDWWLAGKEANKPNTWRDAIACGEWLSKTGWTSGKRTTIWGTSAGGIMAGRAVTERPDLWAGTIASVGVMNAMRFEFGPNGKTNIAEFGTVATPGGAKALRAMDAYLSIEPGKSYPPMLLTAGANDPRVISWQPAKFAARVQEVGKGGPFVFDVDFDQGHGMGSMRSQLDEKAADAGAFVLWAAGHAK